MTDASTFLALAERVEKATGADRKIDRAVAYLLGVGVEKERKLYAEIGAAMWVPAANGLTPHDVARGDRIRQEWQKGTRSKRGCYMPVRIYCCDGPSPLTDCARITGDLSSIASLIERELPELVLQVTFIKGGMGRVDEAWFSDTGDEVIDRDAPDCSSPALAITAAFLRAKASLAGEGKNDA